jgi:MFS family permease
MERLNMSELSTKTRSNTIWTPLFIQAVIINTLVHICTYMMNPISGMYANFLNAPETIVGLVAGFFAVTALLFKIISAPAIDAFNRKYVLVASIAILFVSFIFYYLSKDITMLIISRLLTGAGLAFVPTCCMTIAADALPLEKMSTGIGYFALGTAVAMAAAPTIGLALVGAFGYTHTFAIMAVFMLLIILYALTMHEDYKPVNKFKISVNSVIAKEAIVPSVMLLFLSISFSLVNAFLVLYGNLTLFGNEQATGHTEMGLFSTIYAITMIFTRPMIGKLADKYGTVKVVIPSMVFFAASFLLISTASSLWMFLFAAFIAAFGYGGSQPAIQAVCMKSVPKERRGAASCTSFIGSDIGNLVGPVIAGALIMGTGGANKILGYQSMWRIMIVPILIAMAVSLIFRKQILYAGQSFNPINLKANNIENASQES